MHPIIRVLFAFAILVLQSCGGMLGERGNGVIVTENFSVSDFNRIEVEGNFEIRLEKSGNPGVSVTTDENLLDFISVESRGDRLVLISEKNLISEEGVQVVISYSELRGISVGGAAILTSDQTIAEDYLDLEMSGAGAVELDLEMTALEINVSGAGAMELTGSVVEQRIRMDGAGGLDAGDLISEKCEIDISGVGGAVVHVTESLRASVSGVGGITYRGNPTDVQKDVSGIGSVDPEE
ncbi:MAG: head GIN domain-containing protein [Bacteroidota bacterium]